MIDIALATYNGEKYLKAQLESLLCQSHPDLRIWIGDDRSSDGTVGIARSYSSHYPDRIRLALNDGENLGAKQNFTRLLSLTDAPYVMLADQDDVWLPHKIEKTLGRMKELEDAYGKDTPLLVHSDLKVVDEKLNLISESLWRYQVSDPVRGSGLNRLLLQNIATGCSVMANRPLLDLALPVPSEALMHDWWLALVAAAFGHIGHLPETTALYRQHGSNDTGAKRFDPITLLKSMGDRKAISGRILRQAEAFLQRYGTRIGAREKELLELFVGLPESNFFMRRYRTIRYGFLYTGVIRNIARLLVV